MMKAAKASVGIAVLAVFVFLFLYVANTIITAQSQEEKNELKTSSSSTFERFEYEARRYLGDCSRSLRRDRGECLEYQQTFIEMYVLAMTKKDYIGCLYQVGAFGGLWSSAASVAVPKDAARACAWSRMLSLTTGHNPDRERDFHRFCDALPSRVRDDADARFHEIIDGWNLHAQPPPDGWEPKIMGLAD